MPKKLTTEEFITKAKYIHNNIYDYSLSDYKGTFISINIVCKIHGEFTQRPNDHLSGHGCPKCALNNQIKNRHESINKRKLSHIIQPEEYKIIPIGKNLFCHVDNEDFDFLINMQWHANKDGYANNYKIGLMHRLITKCPPNKVVDHKDGDILNNKKNNLRICDQKNNIYNSRPNKNSKSKYKGVTWDKSKNKWVSKIGFEGKNSHIGYFHSEVEAAKAYDKEAIKLFGEFAYLNFK